MKLETIKRNNKKKIIIGSMIVLSVVGCITLTTTRAKYKSVQSIKLANGTVDYKAPDLKLVAINISEDGINYSKSESVPTTGYTLNEEKSKCRIPTSTLTGENAPIDENVTIDYQEGKLIIIGLNKKNTKCYMYFDKILDSEAPIISDVTTEVTKTEITVTISASDNIGVTEYWYSIDNNAYIMETTNTHTFTGLTSNTSHTIKVYAKDAAGNTSEITTKENVKTKADGAVIARRGGTSSEYTFNYTHQGAQYTVSTVNEEWIIPIGAKITQNSKGYLEFYSGDNLIVSIDMCENSPYTITGNETHYKFNTWICFTGDTELLAYDEKKKKKLKRKVREFKVGDKLYTFDEKQNKFVVTTIKKIEEVHTRDIYAVYLENGEVFRCSEGHAFYVAGAGYMQARELKEGYELLGMDGNVKIAKVEQEHYPEEIALYNLYLDNNTNCFVTGAKVLSYMMTLYAVSTIKKIDVKAASVGC